MSKQLFVIATPLGHLGDFSPRAQEVLKNVNHVVAENPEITKKLTASFELGKKKWLTFAAHNEHESELIARILKALETEDIALISDAGSPGISDPGSHLIAEAHLNGIAVVIIPGPSAVIAAVQSAGYWRSPGFSFHGFLNRQQFPEWKKAVDTVPGPWTHVVFLSPHRGEKELKKLAEAFPQARFTLCFEITKSHERLYRGSSEEILKIEIKWKGECVCVFEIPEIKHEKLSHDELVDWLWSLHHKKAFPPPRMFAKKLAEFLETDVNSVYRKSFTDE